MSTQYSLRVFPNWLPQYNPTWQDATDAGGIDIGNLPSISITVERHDTPLTPTVSDLSLTCRNESGFWDAIFNITNIVGPLPPPAGTQIRAPLLHYGRILLCRKSALAGMWQVVFYGYVDPTSIKFNRTDAEVTFTAFAPGKLLEKGNAERVHRFSGLENIHPAIVPAKPWLILGYDLRHPEIPPGGSTGDNTWWSLRLPGAQAGQGPGVLLVDGNPTVWLQTGDEFEAVAPVAAGAWIEGMKTTSVMSGGPFTITKVVPRTNADGTVDLLFQTQEAPTEALVAGQATMSHLTPWYQGYDWSFLVALLVGGTLFGTTYAGEVNTAMAAAGFGDTISADFTSLPAVGFGTQDHADLIYMADVPLPTLGVMYGLFNGILGLAYNDGSQTPLLRLKGDILAADTQDSGVGIPPFLATNAPAGYIEGPEIGATSRLLSVDVIWPNFEATDFIGPTVQAPFAGQDVHLYDPAGDDFRSTHWMRTPSGYINGQSGNKRFYRIMAVGYLDADGTHYDVGVQITEFLMNTNGAYPWQWVVNSNAQSIHKSLNLTHVYPGTGKDSRPSIKVFQIATGTFLYLTMNPFPLHGAAYAKTNSTDTLAASAIPPCDAGATASFVTGIRGRSSGCFDAFSTYDGTHRTAFFFADREDGTGVDLYYWNGTAMVLGSIVDQTGQGLDLRGGDFINAVFDFTRQKFYVMVENNLLLMQYAFSGSTGKFTVTAWQAVVIDTPNYSPTAERNKPDNAGIVDPGAIAWLTGPVVQNTGPPEPDYTDAADAMIVGTSTAIYVVSNVFSNTVGVANFEGLSVAAAMGQMVLYRGFSMLTGADQKLVVDPTSYLPVPTVKFKQRLGSAATPIDLSSYTEACEDGVWLQLFESVVVTNSKNKNLPPATNDPQFSLPGGQQFTIYRPRYPGSKALALDCVLVATFSYEKLLANAAAAEYIVPRPDATIVVGDPYALNLGPSPEPLDLITYLVKSADQLQGEIIRSGRAMSIDFSLDDALLTIKVA